MPDTITQYKGCLNAAKRKIGIAEFHYQQLKLQLAATEVQSENPPPIPIQAYFEGVVTSIIAAIDQVAQAANYGLSLHLKNGNLVEKGFAALITEIPGLQTWYSNNFGIDLRRIRTRMVHYSYKKMPLALVWTVESTDSKYTGSRDLGIYADKALKYGLELATNFPIIEQKLLEHCQKRLTD